MQEKIYYDPLTQKTPKGPVTMGDEVCFFVQAETDEFYDAYLMIKNDTEIDYFYKKMERCEKGFCVIHKFELAGQFWYNFKLIGKTGDKFLSKTFDNFSYLKSEKREDFLQLVCEKKYAKSCLEGGLIYQIFVDRFCKKGKVVGRKPLILREDWSGEINKNSNDPLVINREVFGGNFEGIISKLDYLKDLGVKTIYLSPISMANSSHKYDTADYMNVDSMFGTNKKFEELVKCAKDKGIGIVIDGVYNHTGSDSIYFNKDKNFDTLGAFNSKNSKFYEWFDFISYPEEYHSWWGINTLPKIKTNSVDFQNYIAGKNGVIEKFMKMGICGVRLDVVDEISDEFVQKIEKKVHEFGSDKIIMGEVWEDASIKTSYGIRRKYFVSNELGSTMNYPFKESILNFLRNKDASNLVSSIRMIENGYPKEVRNSLMNFLSTHDTSRAFSEIEFISGNEEVAKQLYKIATTLLFTLPGVPSIFYGDEYGMKNNAGSSRGCFDWQNYKNENFEWIKKLSKIREYSALCEGEINILESRNGVFAFERFDDKNRIIVLINLKNNKFHVELNGKFNSFISGKEKNSFDLRENEFEILIEKNKKREK